MILQEDGEEAGGEARIGSRTTWRKLFELCDPGGGGIVSSRLVWFSIPCYPASRPAGSGDGDDGPSLAGRLAGWRGAPCFWKTASRQMLPKEPDKPGDHRRHKQPLVSSCTRGGECK